MGHWADVAAAAVGPREKRGSWCWALGRLALVLSHKPLSKAGSGVGAARDAHVRGQAEVRRATCMCVQAVAMVTSVRAGLCGREALGSCGYKERGVHDVLRLAAKGCRR